MRQKKPACVKLFLVLLLIWFIYVVLGGLGVLFGVRKGGDKRVG